MDQPVGNTLGQVKLVFESSTVIPENKVTSKSEYTNSQQDKPVLRVCNIPLTRHAKLVRALGFLFAEKQQKVDP